MSTDPSTSSDTKNISSRNSSISDGKTNEVESKNDDEINEEDKNQTSGFTKPDIIITRPLLTVPEKHEKYQYSQPDELGLRKTLTRSLKKGCACSTEQAKRLLFLRLPIIDWVLNYDVQKGLLGDVISGITVAVMHIPQGMAYAMLANVDPVTGIYMAFFPVIIYAFFASSRHLSMGTFAVICLMTGKIVSEYATFPDENVIVETGTTTPWYTMTTAFTASNDTMGEYTPIEVATIVSFGVGVWMIIFGFLNLGALSVFLSDMLVSGFTTGAAVHVFTSQIKSLFGVTIKSYNGTFQVVLTWGAILKNILDSNPATMVLSMVCIVVLLVNNEVFKPKLRKITMIPIPIELIVVVVGTLASRYGHLNENYDVTIVGPVPTGLPPFTLPPFDLYGKVVMSSLIITIVSYSISFSMAKIFAIQKNYTVDATQELYAGGLGNLIGSMFQCAPISGSLSRSLIQVNVGGYSQLTSFISAAIILLVLLFIGPFFETLPNSVLAAIIVTALKGMFMQFGDVTRMLKISRVDASLWIITFLSVVIIDIDYGLFIGIAYSVILLLGRNQVPSVVLVGQVPNTDIYLEKKRYASVVDVADMNLCQISGTLHYANQEVLRSSICKVTGINPKVILELRRKKQIVINKMRKKESTKVSSRRKKSIDKKDNNSLSSHADDPKLNGRRSSIYSMDPRIVDIEKRFTTLEASKVRTLVLDLSGVGQMDISAAKNIGRLYADYTSAGIDLYFSGISENCLETMVQCGVSKDIPNERFYHSIHDIVSFLTSVKRKKNSLKDNVSDFF